MGLKWAFNTIIRAVVLFLICAITPGLSWSAQPGDIDDDGQVCIDDYRLLIAARNQPADGPDDPRDIDGDGTITVLDARKLILLCGQPRCVCVEPPQNEIPIAHAGPDQDYTLSLGQTMMEITLDGSGSEDPDGTIGAYTWNGDPDPDDTATPTVNLGIGSYEFSLIVTDNLGLASSEDTVHVTINHAPNQPPVADAGDDVVYTLADSQTSILVSLDGSRSIDPENSPLAFSWTGTPDPDDTIDPSIELTTGEYTFSLTVVDEQGLESEPDPVTITVNPAPNQLPEITNSWPPTATPDKPYSHAVLATDPDGDILTYTLSAAPDGMVIDAGTGVVAWAPTADQLGTHPVTVVVADGNGGSTEQNASLLVMANAPPEIVSQPSNSVLEGDLYQYAVEANDPNGDMLSFASSGYSSQADMDASSGLLTWQPADPLTPFSEVDNPHCSAPVQVDSPYWQVGGWQVFHDQGGHAGTQRWGVSADGTTAIAGGNGDPSVYLSDIELSDAVVEISIRVTAGDNDHVGFVWGFQDMQHYYRLRWDQGNRTGLLVTKIDTPEPRYDGSHETDVHLFQNTELRWRRNIEYRFLLDVQPGHAAIYLIEGDQILESIQIKDDRYLTGKFAFYVHSQGGVYYKARYIERQPAPDLVVESVYLQPLNDLEDRIEINIRNRGAVATDMSTPAQIQEGTIGTNGWFTANQVLAELDVPPIAPGETVTLQVDTISLSGLDALLSVELDDANQISECSEGNNNYLTPILDVRVSDPDGLSDQQHFVVNLDDVNEPPQIEPVESRFALLGEVFEAEIMATDPDYGDHVRFELVNGPETMDFLPGTCRLIWVPSSEPVNQDYAVTVRAFDLQGAVDEATFQVTLHRKPEITSTPVYVARRGETYTYDVDAFDPDGDPLTYELVAAPEQMQIDAQTGVISWVAPAPGVYHSVTVRVSDGRDGIAEQHFELGVLEPGEVNIAPSLAHNTPPAQTSALAEYAYQFTTDDPDGLEPVYTLLEGPFSMDLDAASGLLTWSVPITQQCRHAVRLQVYDRRGGFDEFAYTIRLPGGGNPPTITSTPGYDATESVLYEYQVTATDPNGDPLSYLLDQAPAGMTIDETTGLIGWMPTGSQIGIHPIEVSVEDSGCAYSTQSWEINVVERPNTGPQITSQPPVAAWVGQVYTYHIEVTDAENDPITYTLVSAPAGAIFDAQTGSIDWTPAADHIGLHALEVLVADDRGVESAQNWTVGVSDPGNALPEITSQPTTWTLAEENYIYEVAASDPDDDALTFALAAAPAGMTIDPTSGLIQWMAQTGFHDIQVQATDGHGGLAVQAYTLEVAGELSPVQVRLSISPQFINAGETTTISVSRQGGRPPVTLSLEVDGEPLSLDSQGRATITGQTPGTYNVQATAQDPNGSDVVTDIFAVRDVSDATPPVVTLDDEDCVEVTGPYAITGTISEAGAFTYRVLYREKSASEWIELADGVGSGELAGELGQFDPTMLVNGVYEIAVLAEDANGNLGADTGCMIVDGQMKLGPLVLGRVDLELPQMGPDLAVERVYDSRQTDSGDFGPGWHLPQSQVKPVATEVLGNEWDQYVGGGYITTYYLLEKKQHIVTIRFSDEDVVKFKMDVNPKSSALYPFGEHMPNTVSYLPLDTTQGSLEAIGVSSSVMLIDGQLREEGVDLYNPQRFRYTRPDGTTYVVSAASGIESVTDTYGRTVSYDAAGIHHSSGASLSFERGAGDRIERIADPLGRTVEYTYDADGNLASVVRSGNGSFAARTLENMAYAQGVADKPVLKTITSPDGEDLGTFTYDADGRMIGMTDANGAEVVYGFNLPGFNMSVTDRNGNNINYAYDERGLVTTKTAPDGSTTEVAYDDRGNKTGETDPLGHVTAFTYDGDDNLLTETDPEGNTTTYTYNDRNQVLTRTDPEGHTTVYTYDTHGNQLTETDPAGRVTTHTYDTDGNRITTEDPLGRVAEYQYDSRGFKTHEVDIDGNETGWLFDDAGNQTREYAYRTNSDGDYVVMTTRMDYDDAGNLLATEYPDGTVTSSEYDNRNQKTADIDAEGNRTEYEYDANGNQTAVFYPDGTSQETTFDNEGNRLTSTDRSGRTTSFVYDSANRLVATTHPDGATTAMEYDAAGRLTATIDENGNRSEYEYDDASRRTLVRDALGNETSFAYDGNGNQVSMTDALGHTTAFEYDSAGNRVSTTFPDGSYTTTAYDAQGRKTAETDAAGRTTTFDYDGAGRLLSVTDTLGQETVYTFDEVGNKLTQTDPNGHTKTWAYDDMGRVVRHTLAGGQFETFTYTVNGSVETHTDFNGHTTSFDYDVCCGRLLTKTFPDGSTVAYTYTGTGKRESVTDARGVTTYAYDLRDRLIEETRPDGSTIDYTYDAKGNRTSVTTASGTVTYGFDELNRLELVTDPDGAETAYTYDAAGNRESVTQPSGVATTYTYDNLYRLLGLENRQADGTVLTSYTYTLGLAGNRTRVVEHSGRQVDYAYDGLYRLTEEAISDPVNGDETIAYTYDAFGNRLTKTAAAGATTYVYDANDLLLTESGPAGTTTHTYDANGNTTAKDDGTTSVAYTYDFENRLISVDGGVTITTYAYDADGIRVAAATDGATTHYVVDKNRPYAQVLEERDPAGSLTVSYVYGDDLISQDRSGIDRYYLYDGQMSTRGLTSAAGDLTDTYTYDAFGILIDRTGSSENSYLYTGEQYDTYTGFYYLRARYYDQSSGRFLTVDPYQGRVFEPVTLHNYLFANANPVMNSDPSGLMSLHSVMNGLAIASVLQNIGTRYVSFSNQGSIIWKGRLYVGSIGIGKSGDSDSAGVIIADLHSEPTNGRKAMKAKYMIIMAGLSYGIPYLPQAAYTWGDVELEIPAVFDSPDYLQGPASWISATAVFDKGRSYTTMSLGYALGDFSIYPDPVEGYDIAIDLMFGASIMISR